MEIKGMKILLFLALGLIMTACSPRLKYNVLSFMFDGVPEPEITTGIIGDDSQETVEIPVDTLDTAVSLTLGYTYHYPYAEKECLSCHDENAVGELNDTEPELCYMCHTDFRYEYESLHGPVDAGYCAICHQPHMSKNPKLLVEKGNNLCFNCHVIGEIPVSDAHNPNGDFACIDCHNPHGSNNVTVSNYQQ